MKKFYTLVIFLISLFYSSFYYGNYMLIQNVAMTGENTGAKTVQVQFDISWENSWLDEVNFDAAWVFVKYKDTNGDWHHATINTDGYSNGSGTLNQIDVTEDKVGAFFRTRYYGGGNFDADNVQLQWAYGSDGLSDINGIEIRVFAIEMVYVPEGDFNCSPRINNILLYAPGNNAAVINSRLSPVLTYNGDSLRIKGNAGVDTDNDGYVPCTPTGDGWFGAVSKLGGDCNDANTELNPETIWYRDDDGDTFGVSSNRLVQCLAPAGYVLESGDCDDARLDVNPAAPELCDSIDNDCDSVVDDDDDSIEDRYLTTYYRDVDGDFAPLGRALFNATKK